MRSGYPAKHSRLLATTVLGFGLVAAPFAFDISLGEGELSITQQSAAAQNQGARQGSGQRGGGQWQGQGGSDGTSVLEDRIFRGSGKRIIIILEDDGDESDRPAWAGGNRELNPHGRGTSGRPPGAGVGKGDLYGDLYIILRDDNGVPILDDNGNVQPVLADGTVIQLTEDGEVPPEYADLVVEVEFGRTSVVRSPSHVLLHALDEAISKLDAATVITVDNAGRLVVDGVTIDSPLENISLYAYIMTGGTVANLPANFDPAALLGAASDKFGSITIDMLVNLNTILGINTVDVSSGTITYYDFSSYDYSRADTYAGVTVTYLKDDNGDGIYETVTESLMEAVFGNEDWVDTTAGGVDDFTQAADDSRAVILFLHDVPVPVATN
jgi:hypothetical protein